jgi:type VI secretion system protein ImpM
MPELALKSDVGVFGKVPNRGDFVRIGLARGFVTAWDGWLQDCFPKVRAALGSRWNETYMTAPIWRFSLAPGVVGDAAWVGVMMASNDRVGRHFPLTLAAQIDAGTSHVEAHFIGESTYLEMEGAALSALDEDVPFEDFQHRVTSIRNCPAAPVHCVQRSGQLVVVGSDRMQSRGILAARYVSEHLKGSSLWSSDDGQSARLLGVEGLPGPKATEALFDMKDPFWSVGGAA